MADLIDIKNGALSSKLLKTALMELRGCDEAMTDDEMYDLSTIYCHDAATGWRTSLFSTAAVETARAAQKTMYEVYEEMERVAGILNSGPDEIEDADKSFKGRNSNWLQRTRAKGSIVLTTLGFSIGSLFKHGGKKTGIESEVKNDEGTTRIVIRESVENTYQSTPTYKYWGITETDVAEIVESSQTEEEAQQKLQQALKEKLDAAVANGYRADTSAYPKATTYSYYYYDGKYYENNGAYVESDGCTWYAFNRYREVNNEDLLFHGEGGGNAKDWDDRIDTEKFDKISTSDDCNGITNAIAVDNEGSPVEGVYLGHVAYVEAIIGDTVYMSEGWYNGGFQQTGLRTMKLSDFTAKYETLITAKRT